MGEATNFKFCMHIDMIDWNKISLNISALVAVSILRDSRKFSVIFVVAQLSCFIFVCLCIFYLLLLDVINDDDDDC